MNIYEKLQLANVKLQELSLNKSGENEFSSYYELEDFATVNKIFYELKLYSEFSAKEGEVRLKIINTEKPAEQTVFFSSTDSIDLKSYMDAEELRSYMKRCLYIKVLQISENLPQLDTLDAVNDLSDADIFF